MKPIIRAKEQKSIMVLMTCALLACVFMTGAGQCERIKDIVDIQGLRSNPLSGVGLVIGLAGNGDSGVLSRQMLTNMLRESGLVLTPTDLTSGNQQN
jgi:flagellar P-ring protein precursor FlgI